MSHKGIAYTATHIANNAKTIDNGREESGREKKINWNHYVMRAIQKMRN
jgi:hypothetical protein